MPPQKQLTLFVTFYVQSSCIEKWKTAHRPVWTACAAEPEYIYFEIFQNPKKPGQFRLVEVWNESREWFEMKQLTKPYYGTLWEWSRPTWEKEIQIEYMERLGEGMSYKDTFLKA